MKEKAEIKKIGVKTEKMKIKEKGMKTEKEGK